MEKLFSLFPERKFTVKNIYMKDIFAFGASNSAAVEFDLEAKLQDGSPYSNSYVILIHIKGGKAVRSKEFPYDFDAVKVALGE
jgi:ketosteroid isomerase-like protein